MHFKVEYWTSAYLINETHYYDSGWAHMGFSTESTAVSIAVSERKHDKIRACHLTVTVSSDKGKIFAYNDQKIKFNE